MIICACLPACLSACPSACLPACLSYCLSAPLSHLRSVSMSLFVEHRICCLFKMFLLLCGQSTIPASSDLLHLCNQSLAVATDVLPHSITYIPMHSSYMLCLHQLHDQFAVAAVLRPQSITSPQFSAPTCFVCTMNTCCCCCRFAATELYFAPIPISAPTCCACISLMTSQCCCSSFAATEQYLITILSSYMLCLQQFDDQSSLLLQFCGHRALQHPNPQLLHAVPAPV